MDDENRESFAKYRLEKAKETLKSAQILFEVVKDYTGANNRAYYRSKNVNFVFYDTINHEKGMKF